MSKDQHFSIYGSGYAKEHAEAEGARELIQSVTWRQVGLIWTASVLVLCFTAGVAHVITNAEAAAHFAGFFGAR